MSENTVWCFAYGSNLNKKQMANRLGKLPPSRIARLPDYRLAFNKRGSQAGEVYANIVPENGGEVWGVVYRCQPVDLEKLDQYEGVSTGHYRRCRLEVVAGSDTLQAEVYVAEADWVCDERPPKKEYADKILSGAAEHCLPEHYVQALKRLVHLSSPSGERDR